MEQPGALVIGGGPAGLALAACLKKAGVGCLVFEQQEKPGACWRRHYDRLHLHTPRSISTLPYFPYKSGTPKYPSRDQFVSYLDDYCRHFGIYPLCNTEVFSTARKDGRWLIQSSAGPFASRFLVFATGKSQIPRPFTPPGIDGFTGTMLHSAHYKSGVGYKGKKVLVVGFGNSACEIAMDLCDHGATVIMSVRSPVNVIPRDLFGIPVLYWSTMLSPLPARAADRITAPLLRLALGDITELGLRKASYGPSVEVREYKKIPAIDIGALGYIRRGKIRVTGAVESVSGNGIIFAGGFTEGFDAIIAATGYDICWPEIKGLTTQRVEDLKKPSFLQTFFGRDDVYSCGFGTSGTGMIRAIGKEAVQIAHHVRIQSGK